MVAEMRQKLAQAQAETPKGQPISAKSSEEQVSAWKSRSSDIHGCTRTRFSDNGGRAT